MLWEARYPDFGMDTSTIWNQQYPVHLLPQRPLWNFQLCQDLRHSLLADVASHYSDYDVG